MLIHEILKNVCHHLTKRALCSLLFVGMTFTLASCGFVSQLPIAIGIAAPTEGESPLAVVFDGSQSFHPGGTIASFSWNFNDGSPTASGKTVSHTFLSEGDFTVVMTVTDERGSKDSDKLSIHVGRSSIYYSSDRRTSVNYELMRMDTDGSNQAQVTVGSAPADDVFPSLVPNTRSKLAFASDRASPGLAFFDIFVSNPDGTLPSNLTVAQTDSQEIEPSWAPDGSQIAFASNQSASFEIFIMDADGTDSTPLTTTSAGGKAVAPTISPDGSRIAFASNCDVIALSSGKASLSGCGSDFEIFVMSFNSSNAVTAVAKLTSNTTDDGAVGPDLGPAGLNLIPVNLGFGSSTLSWSRDGTKLAYAAHPGTSTDIYVCDFSSATNACTSSSPLPNASDSGFEEFDPYWFTETGVEKLAFTTNRPSGGTAYEIWKVKLDGTGLTQLTSLGANVQPAGEGVRK